LKQDFGHLFVKLLLQICSQHVEEIFDLINRFEILQHKEQLKGSPFL
jgi:hypothetical protein